MARWAVQPPKTHISVKTSLIIGILRLRVLLCKERVCSILERFFIVGHFIALVTFGWLLPRTFAALVKLWYLAT